MPHLNTSNDAELHQCELKNRLPDPAGRFVIAGVPEGTHGVAKKQHRSQFELTARKQPLGSERHSERLHPERGHLERPDATTPNNCVAHRNEVLTEFAYTGTA
ncbi:hypothetical protein Mal48_37560 [Thalassoglobus polymorphus]|uniref:Uncharacterized protein n=1 Tax=Thalassoglobus polymorphus TaxID=2527994 RepID=A0A517QSA1_9PLAN|nr:hypothetical protein Mal48_37560 [Thalassoglobus polymorphus]